VVVVSPAQDEQVELDPVAVPDERLLLLDLVLGEAVARGRVVDQRGRALAGAAVEIRASPTEVWGQGRCDPDGNFAIRGLRAGEAIAWAGAAGYLAALSPRLELRPQAPVEVPTFRLQKGAVLHGLVGAPDQRPRSGARVLLIGADGGPIAEQDSDPAGRYRFEGLDRGPFTLRIEDGEYAPFQRSAIELELGAERELPVVLGPGAGLVVRAIDGSGAPVAGVRLELEPVGDLPYAENGDPYTDVRGEWQRLLLAPGAYRVEAARDGIVQSAQLELHEGQKAQLTFEW
jgi:hypothetical protein